MDMSKSVVWQANKYRHGGSSSPAWMLQSVAERTPAATSKSVTAALIRAARLRDLLASIAEWQRATGPERDYWREEATWRLSQWRRLHREPERRAFEAAVAESRL